MYKEKYQRLKESNSRGGSGGVSSSAESYLDHARSALASQQQRMNSTLDEDDTHGGFHSVRSSASRAGSQASLGSGLANHARSIVGSFSCAGSNPHSGGVVAQELAEHRDAEIREMAFRHDSGMRDRDRRRNNNDKRQSGSGHNNINMTYSDRSFSTDTQSQQSGGYQRRTPHSVASGSTRSKSSRSFREVGFVSATKVSRQKEAIIPYLLTLRFLFLSCKSCSTRGPLSASIFRQPHRLSYVSFCPRNSE